MSHLRALDADVEAALEPINVPAYVIDKHGIIRWINPAARKVVGDVRGRQYTSVCAPEETRHAREVFAQKVVGGAKVTDVEGVLIDANGERIKVELSSVPLYSGGHIVGVLVRSSTSRRTRSARRILASLRDRPKCCACWTVAIRPHRSPRSST